MRSTTSGKAVINTYPPALSDEGDKAFFFQNPDHRWRARPASQREAQQVRLFDANGEGFPVSIVALEVLHVRRHGLAYSARDTVGRTSDERRVRQSPDATGLDLTGQRAW